MSYKFVILTQDARFNSALDRQSNFVTKSILTVPVIDHFGKGVAVIQVPSLGNVFLFLLEIDRFWKTCNRYSRHRFTHSSSYLLRRVVKQGTNETFTLTLVDDTWTCFSLMYGCTLD